MSVQSTDRVEQPDGNDSFGKSNISVETSLTYDELLERYNKELEAHARLQKTYDEMQIMVRHQQKMFAVVKQLYNEQVEAASTDAVTGLPNHRAIMNRIEEEIVQCTDNTSFAILFIDLDHFKQVNDTWGHRAGDAILQEVGSRLRAGIRESDFVGRYGGEEFAVILAGGDLESASQMGERLRVLIADVPCTYEVEDTQTIVSIPVTASFGISSFRLHGTTRNALIESADTAMYLAKRTGRNRICKADIPLLALSENA